MTFGMICPGILRPVILNVKKTVSVSVNQGFYYENSAYVLFTVYLGRALAGLGTISSPRAFVKTPGDCFFSSVLDDLWEFWGILDQHTSRSSKLLKNFHLKFIQNHISGLDSLKLVFRDRNILGALRNARLR